MRKLSDDDDDVPLPRVELIRREPKKPRRGNNAAVERFVVEIRASWQKAVTSIFETGRLLIRARDELDEAEWCDLFDLPGTNQIPFGERTAERLMAIARHPVLATHVSRLPPSWGTLYQLATLPDAELERLLAEGRINPEMQRKEVEVLKREFDERDIVFNYEALRTSLRRLIAYMRYYDDDPAEALEKCLRYVVRSDDLDALQAWLGKLSAGMREKYVYNADDDNRGRWHARWIATQRKEERRYGPARARSRKQGEYDELYEAGRGMIRVGDDDRVDDDV
jgi:hypothetical protein